MALRSSRRRAEGAAAALHGVEQALLLAPSRPLAVHVALLEVPPSCRLLTSILVCTFSAQLRRRNSCQLRVRRELLRRVAELVASDVRRRIRKPGAKPPETGERRVRPG